jgi:hypothetical protein
MTGSAPRRSAGFALAYIAFFAISSLAAGSVGSWTSTGSLGTGRYVHTATLLPSGKVLVAGGDSATTSGGVNPSLASAELYDPATGTWTATGSLGTARGQYTATLLASGKVLAAGGRNTFTGGVPFNYFASSELYDPATGTWTATGSLGTARTTHTATLLPSGKVLVAGGFYSLDGGYSAIYLTSAELYDPGTGTWTSTGSLGTARGSHTATLLSSGKVLVAGGAGNSGFLASAELYDPATGTWAAMGSLATTRYGHTATLLPSGKVLVAGGANGVALAELYDPGTGTWAATGSPMARQYVVATLLPSGKVLVEGGGSNSGITASAELYTTCDSPTAAVSGSASICSGTSTTIQAALTGSAPWSVTWSDGLTQTGVSSSPAARSVSPSSTTTYTVTAMSDAECVGTASGSATVTVNPLPAATISANGPTTFCKGGSVALAAAPSGGSGSFSSYQWYRNGSAIGGATGASYSAVSSGTYAATVTDSAGCTSPASNGIAVTVIPLPTATVSGTAAVCKGTGTTIQAALTGTSPWNLTWSDGFTQTVAVSPATRSVAPNLTTTYTVTSVSDANCISSGSGSAVVTVELPPKATVTGGGSICAGSSATIQAALTGTSPWNLVWSDGFAQTVSASPASRTVSPATTTAYSLTAVSDAACAGGGSGSATIKVDPVPSSAITAPASVCANSSGNAASVPNAGGQATYSWSISNGTITSGAGSKSIKFSAGSTGSVTITITVTSPSGCASTSTITIPINC